MFILSPAWIYVLITTVFVHWLLPSRWRGYWVIGASAAFLGWLSPFSLFLLSALTLILQYGAGRFDHISGRRLIILILITGGILSIFKVRAVLFPSTLPDWDLDPLTANFVIPLGLSYYAFRCIHYAIEKFKGTIPAHGAYDLIHYLFFLPTFWAGPIHRFHDFQRDMRRKRWDPYMFARGIERLIYGYTKVAFLANLLMPVIIGSFVRGVENEHLQAYLNMVKDTATLYFLFSGFSDIAIGFGMLLGFKVMENFNFPFLARNISDFWRRWHISLTSWCRDYVYMGTISVTRSAALAAAAAMIVMGLWHEFSLRFLCWGIYQGAGIIIWQKFQGLKPYLPAVRNKAALRILQILSTLLTLHYFMFGTLFAENATLGDAWTQMQMILLFWL